MIPFKNQLDTQLKIGRYIVDITVYYWYYSPHVGVRYYPDGSGEPPTPADIAINSVKVWGLETFDGLDINREWLKDRGWLSRFENYVTEYCIELSYLNDNFYRDLCDAVVAE